MNIVRGKHSIAVVADAYAPRPTPTYEEVIAACETLLCAGFRDEAIMVLMSIMGLDAKRMLTG